MPISTEKTRKARPQKSIARDELITFEFYENQDGELIKIIPDDQGRLHSKVLPGFWLKSDWLAANHLPPVLKTLQEILGEGHRLI